MRKTFSVVLDSPKQTVMRDFMRIPGVGRQIAEDLYKLGYQTVEELRGEDPQLMYERMCQQQRITLDRCMLYVLRCAVYYASTDRPDPDLLKWWRWKDVPFTVPLVASTGQPQRTLPAHEFTDAKLAFKTTS